MCPSCSSNPILVPTLAELAIELGRADANRAALESDPGYDAALLHCWSVLDQIAELPAASLADLRIKARAFDWSARLLDDEPYHNPSDGEQKIMRQLVAGLLDEGSVPANATATEPEDIASIPFEGHGVDVNDLMPDRDQWQVQWTGLWMMLSTLNDDKAALTAKLVAMEKGGASEAFLNSLDTVMAENKRLGELLDAVHNRVLVAAANAIGEM